MMKKILYIFLFLIPLIAVGEVVPGAACADDYVDMLRGKRVALLSNHTGMVGNEHTLDILLRNGVDVKLILSPEHGFRGTADAGEHVGGGVDAKTGIKIVSLYGGKSKTNPLEEAMAQVDVVVSDMQDVGLRFYTYYITMLDAMNAAARHGKKFVVLDRPNPNGMTVDGPVLDMSLASGVGRLPIPVVHGLTLGEMARMIVGERWLDQGRPLDLEVIRCRDYTHSTRYELPIAPSPNLKSMKAVYLYPSTCLFEGTVMSLGRGTDRPFEMYGHPQMTGCSYSFTPRSMPGAKNPPLLNKRCYGRDLGGLTDDEIIAGGVNLQYIIEAYRNAGMKREPKFFTSFFDKLIGNRNVRTMIEQGKSAKEIKATWAKEVENFKLLRNKYLLYPL